MAQASTESLIGRFHLLITQKLRTLRKTFKGNVFSALKGGDDSVLSGQRIPFSYLDSGDVFSLKILLMTGHPLFEDPFGIRHSASGTRTCVQSIAVFIFSEAREVGKGG